MSYCDGKGPDIPQTGGSRELIIRGSVFKYPKDWDTQMLLNFIIVSEDLRAKDKKSEGNELNNTHK